MNTHVDFETAKLLKEKGFDEPVYAIYSGNQLGIFTENDKIFNKWNHCRDATYSAPTITEVVMWLYEKHGIWISVTPNNNSEFGFMFTIYKYDEFEKIELCSVEGWNSPTKASQEAIKYTLKHLIK